MLGVGERESENSIIYMQNRKQYEQIYCIVS